MTDSSTDHSLVIQQLEQEIAELRHTLFHQKQENKLLEAWRDHVHGRKTESGPTDVTNALVESLQYQKDMLEKVTGVAITDSRTESLSQGGKTKMVRDAKTGRWSREAVNMEEISGDTLMSHSKRQIVQGSCGDTEFQLHLDIEENITSDGIIHADISRLSISASESIYTDMKDTIERLANERNAQGFLRMLDSYETWRSAREKAFHHFVAEYPKIAKSVNRKVLHLAHPTKKFTFVIEWQLQVTDLYRIVPNIQLHMQVPKKVQPETDVLTTAPEKFQLMLKELGIEKTFKTLLMLLLK